MQPLSQPSTLDSLVVATPATTSGKARFSWEPYLYLLPAFIVFTIFVAVPVGGTVILSLTAWNGISWNTAEFVALDNYVTAFKDDAFWGSLWNNLKLLPFFVILPAVLGLIPAVIVHQGKIRGEKIFQAGLFLPYIMPGVLIGVVWKWLLNPVFGPVNDILDRLGLPTRSWLGDFTWALPTVGLIGAWAAYGFCYVVFVAGLQKIATDLYEAARLDGASGWQEFLAVSLPGLKREIAVVLSVNLIGALRAFDVIRATTDGGPGFETRVLALYMIDVAFNANRAGYGSALAVLLAIVTLVLSGLVLKAFGEGDD